MSASAVKATRRQIRRVVGNDLAQALAELSADLKRYQGIVNEHERKIADLEGGEVVLAEWRERHITEHNRGRRTVWTRLRWLVRGV